MNFPAWYQNFLAWLETTAIADAIRTTPWMYPTFESLHYIGLALLVGGILLIDLRTLGVARALPLRSMIGLLPWVWIGFLINVFTGSLLFIYGATSFGMRPPFLLKMSFMVLAGINALLFDRATRRGDWVDRDDPPGSVRLFATLSLLLWVCVVTAGRFMAYI